MTCFKIATTICALCAACLAIWAGLIKLPQSPKEGDIVSAGVFQELFKKISKAGKLNALAGMFVIFSIILSFF